MLLARRGVKRSVSFKKLGRYFFALRHFGHLSLFTAFAKVSLIISKLYLHCILSTVCQTTPLLYFSSYSEAHLQSYRNWGASYFWAVSVFNLLEPVHGDHCDKRLFVRRSTRNKGYVSNQLLPKNFKLKFSVGFYKYSYASLSNLLSSWFRYEALKLVSFTTVMIVKGSRLFPIMFVNKLMKKTKFQMFDWFTAFLLCSGSIARAWYLHIVLIETFNFKIQSRKISAREKSIWSTRTCRTPMIQSTPRCLELSALYYSLFWIPSPQTIKKNFVIIMSRVLNWHLELHSSLHYFWQARSRIKMASLKRSTFYERTKKSLGMLLHWL